MKISHAAVLVVIRQGKLPGQFELLSFVYTRQKAGQQPFSSWKFPVESWEPGESRWKTAANGMVRELSANPDNPEGFEFRALGPKDANGEPVPFLVSRVRGDPGKEDDFHDKCVFIVELSPDSVGMLRTEPKWDAKDELLDPPQFVEMAELWRLMTERGQPFHRAVLYQVILHLGRKFGTTMNRYRDIIEDPHSQDAMVSRGRQIEFM